VFLEKVRDLQANLKADQELLVYYETASGEITKKAGLDPIVVQTRRSILASMSESLLSRQPLPEARRRCAGQTVLVVDDVETERTAVRTPLSPGPSSACVAKPLTVLKR